MSARGTDTAKPKTVSVIGGGPLSIEAVLGLASGSLRAKLSAVPEDRARRTESRAVLERLERAGASIYGVTTGVGASSAARASNRSILAPRALSVSSMRA